jgi:CheY-like chemotaxis protein
MDKKTKKRAFEPSFTTDKVGKGTGLGLTSSYGFVKEQEDTINAHSEKGHGMTFSIYHPASGKETSHKGSVKREMIGGKETILVVDDDDMVIDVSEQMLTLFGYKVFIARSGHEALMIYEKNGQDIDLVILDMMMPSMGGGEVFGRLQKINTSVKVLIASGSCEDYQAAEILNQGCKGFIQKPFTAQQLSQKVRKVLDED